MLASRASRNPKLETAGHGIVLILTFPGCP
jgi:hypothetical protein